MSILGSIASLAGAGAGIASLFTGNQTKTGAVSKLNPQQKEDFNLFLQQTMSRLGKWIKGPPTKENKTGMVFKWDPQAPPEYPLPRRAGLTGLQKQTTQGAWDLGNLQSSIMGQERPSFAQKLANYQPGNIASIANMSPPMPGAASTPYQFNEYALSGGQPARPALPDQTQYLPKNWKMPQSIIDPNAASASGLFKGPMSMDQLTLAMQNTPTWNPALGPVPQKGYLAPKDKDTGINWITGKGLFGMAKGGPVYPPGGAQKVNARRRAKGGSAQPGQGNYMVGEIGPELNVTQSGRKNMVGEQGPEMFSPNEPGQIVPNNQLPSMMQQGQGPQDNTGRESGGMMGGGMGMGMGGGGAGMGQPGGGSITELLAMIANALVGPAMTLAGQGRAGGGWVGGDQNQGGTWGWNVGDWAGTPEVDPGYWSQASAAAPSWWDDNNVGPINPTLPRYGTNAYNPTKKQWELGAQTTQGASSPYAGWKWQTPAGAGQTGGLGQGMYAPSNYTPQYGMDPAYWGGKPWSYNATNQKWQTPGTSGELGLTGGRYNTGAGAWEMDPNTDTYAAAPPLPGWTFNQGRWGPAGYQYPAVGDGGGGGTTYDDLPTWPGLGDEPTNTEPYWEWYARNYPDAWAAMQRNINNPQLAYDFDPATYNQEFNSMVYDPAMSSWQRNTAPWLQEKFVSSGNVIGSEMPQYLTRQAGEQASKLEGQRFQGIQSGIEREAIARQNMINNQQTATNTMLSMSNMPAQAMSTEAQTRRTLALLPVEVQQGLSNIDLTKAGIADIYDRLSTNPLVSDRMKADTLLTIAQGQGVEANNLRTQIQTIGDAYNNYATAQAIGGAEAQSATEAFRAAYEDWLNAIGPSNRVSAEQVLEYLLGISTIDPYVTTG